MKKLFCVILSAIILSTTMFAVSAAEVTNSVSATPEESQEQTTEGYCDGFYYNVLDDGTAEITRYDGNETDLVIPDEIEGYQITSIRDNTFQSEFRKNVTIGKHINHIVDNGNQMYNFFILENIYVNKANNHFYDINGILFSKDTNEMLCYPPKNETTELTIPEGIVTTCKISSDYLKSLYIPSSITALGNINCINLENINVCKTNQTFCSIDGVLYNKQGTKLLYLPCALPLTDFIIPNSVTSIVWTLNPTKTIKNITINKNCNEIQLIGSSSSETGSLENIYVEEGNQKYFSQNGILLEKGLQNFQDSVKIYPQNNKNKSFYFPNNTKIIQLPQRNLKYLEDVYIPASADKMLWQSFSWCPNIKNIYVDKDNSEFCDIDGVMYNKDKTTLLKYTSGREATSFVVPDTVTTISSTAFNQNYNLKNISFPDSIINFDSIFWYCNNLTDFTFSKHLKNIKWIHSIGYGFVGDMGHGGNSNTPLDNVVIRGYTNSPAETYAKENGFTFISLGTINKLGDSNSDNKVDISDATNIQRYLAEYEIDFSENEDIASDTNGDGYITISDVTEIQRFLAELPSAMSKS